MNFQDPVLKKPAFHGSCHVNPGLDHCSSGYTFFCDVHDFRLGAVGGSDMMVDMSNFDPLFLTAATSQLSDYQGTHAIQKYRLFFAIYMYIHIYIYTRYAPSNFLQLKIGLT